MCNSQVREKPQTSRARKIAIRALLRFWDGLDFEVVLAVVNHQATLLYLIHEFFNRV